VGERTIHTWPEDPAFRLLVGRLGDQVPDRSIGRLTNAATRAVAVMEGLLDAYLQRKRPVARGCCHPGRDGSDTATRRACCEGCGSGGASQGKRGSSTMGLNTRLASLSRRLAQLGDEGPWPLIWAFRKAFCQGKCPDGLASGGESCADCGGFNALAPDEALRQFHRADMRLLGIDDPDHGPATPETGLGKRKRTRKR
jgi:hypothetical protein